MKFVKSILILTLLVFIGCTKSEITIPPSPNDSNLIGTVPLSFTGGASIKSMEGIYKLSGGSDDLGTQFVCKVSKYKVSFFSNASGIYIILKYGYKAADGSIQFSGFWRYSEKPDQGTIQFTVSAADGATALLAGVVSNLKLQGVFSGKQMTMQFKQEFTTYAKNNPFMIFAHHGIHTYSDPPFAENSMKVILNGEDYGVNGLELDVRLTSDNVPILIHDATINTRLTKKGPVFGSWDIYPFSFIDNYVTLIDGQKVPTVKDVLRAFIDETTMKYIWLDVKGNKDIFKYMEPIVREAYKHATDVGRDVVIFAGLTSSDNIDEYKKQPTYRAGNSAYAYSLPLPSLAEQSLDKAIENGSQYFGPRYTTGLLLDEVERAHNLGIKVISWTLNSRAFIVNYLDEGNFDGFITDYPAYVVYEYYTRF